MVYFVVMSFVSDSFDDLALYFDRVKILCFLDLHLIVILSDLLSINTLWHDILVIFVLNIISSVYVFSFISVAIRDPFDSIVASSSNINGWRWYI